MSPMKMLSMASAAIALVLVFVMLDNMLPEVFIRLFILGFLIVATAFLAYRLKLAFDMIQQQGKTRAVPKPTMHGIYALGVITFVFGATALYLLLNPVWNVGVMSAGGLTILLVFIISRSVLHIDILPLLGVDDPPTQ